MKELRCNGESNNTQSVCVCVCLNQREREREREKMHEIKKQALNTQSG